MFLGALAKVVEAAVPGAKIVDLCVLGDRTIEEGTATVYNKAKFDRGVAFPTSVSTNNMVGHFSPLSGDETVLQEGDLVKVYLVQKSGSIPLNTPLNSKFAGISEHILMVLSLKVLIALCALPTRNNLPPAGMLMPFVLLTSLLRRPCECSRLVRRYVCSDSAFQLRLFPTIS